MPSTTESATTESATPDRRRCPRLLTTAALAAVLAVAGPPAQAHVTARADSTTSGSFSAITFRVPNESDRASTVRVSVELPPQTPLLYVSSKPVPGWQVVATEEPLPEPVETSGTTITKAVRTVTWSADPKSGIGPGEYQEFSLSVGPLPAAGTLLLPVEQTYSDGEVARWDQPTPEGGDEPEHPAPVLVVTAAPAAQGSGPAPSATSAASQVGGSVAGSDGTARGLAGGALGLALAALLVAIVGYRRRAGSTP